MMRDEEEGRLADGGGWPVGPAALSLLRVGAAQTTFAEDAAERARAQFERFGAIHLAELLEPEFFRLVNQLAGASEFDLHESAVAVQEHERSPQRAGRVINLALSRTPFLDWLEEVTGCGSLRGAEGRVAQTRQRPGDQLDWHDDLIDRDRRLAIVLNLSEHAFTGGEFQMRTKTGEALFEHRYVVPGSALIFKVDAALEHRVLPLTGGGPRRVFAGWAFARSVE